MTESNIKGNDAGVRLWSLMSASDDPSEQEYFRRLSDAATKFGQVWFTDMITQTAQNRNQTIWRMFWNRDDQFWSIERFLIPEGAEEMSPRLIENKTVESDDIWIDINPDDLISI